MQHQRIQPVSSCPLDGGSTLFNVLPLKMLLIRLSLRRLSTSHLHPWVVDTPGPCSNVSSGSCEKLSPTYRSCWLFINALLEDQDHGSGLSVLDDMYEIQLNETRMESQISQLDWIVVYLERTSAKPILKCLQIALFWVTVQSDECRRQPKNCQLLNLLLVPEDLLVYILVRAHEQLSCMSVLYPQEKKSKDKTIIHSKTKENKCTCMVSSCHYIVKYTFLLNSCEPEGDQESTNSSETGYNNKIEMADNVL